jgi:hypothetical protein
VNLLGLLLDRALRRPDGTWRRDPDRIGHPDCPNIVRWTPLSPPWRRSTLANGYRIRVTPKVMLHRFLPTADDRDPHDHPWPFVTLVLAGRYDDLAPCDHCRGSGECGCAPGPVDFDGPYPCHECGGRRLVLRERLSAPAFRYRPPEHAHVTRTAEGCWTLVLAWRKARSWGFWVGGEWMPWRRHQETYGHGVVCDDG